MRYLYILLFLVSTQSLFCEKEESPSLFEALQIFYEKNGGALQELEFYKKAEPKIEDSLKALLIDLAKEQTTDSTEKEHLSD